MQNGVHLLGDRHLDVPGSGQTDSRSGGENPFRNHAVHAGKNFRQLSAATKFYTYAAIAGESAGASQHQVSETGEARHGFRFASAGDDQASHLRQAACDEAGNGVVPQAEPRANSSGDGDCILQRSAKFDADGIFVGINAKAGMAEFLLDGARQFFVVGCEGDGGRVSTRGFERERGAAERANSRQWRTFAVQNLRRSPRSCAAKSFLPVP